MIPKTGEIYELPSGRFVRVDRAQLNDSFGCSYVNREGQTIRSRSLTPGVTLTSEFIEMKCRRVR